MEDFPQRQAKRVQEEAQRKREAEARRAEQIRQATLINAGPALLENIKWYDQKGKPAETRQVEKDFSGAFPGEFQGVLEELKAAGQVVEVTHSNQGYFGEKTTHLHVID
jgi:hypothetical protein